MLCGMCAPRKRHPLPRISLPHAIAGIAGLLAVLAVLVYGSMALMGFFDWSERVTLPVREWFGGKPAMSVAYEDDGYFRKFGTRVDYLTEDIETLAIRSMGITEYKIIITERIADLNYGALNPSYFIVEQSITFEHHDTVIKVDVSPVLNQPASAPNFYGSLFTEYRLLPYGTYYIVTEDGETYILMDTGIANGTKIANRTKSVVRASDNPMLYDKLLSFGIERIIDYDAFTGGDISCYEAAGVREYSAPLSYDASVSGIFLREYESKPVSYQMVHENNDEGTRHFIRTDFHYLGVNNKTPKLSDYQ